LENSLPIARFMTLALTREKIIDILHGELWRCGTASMLNAQAVVDYLLEDRRWGRRNNRHIRPLIAF
jgi:hypothetical protein